MIRSRASSRSSDSTRSSGGPADAAQRTLIALDCGSALRIDRAGAVAGRFAQVVNIDHHHDNTLFGDLQPRRCGASCTAEIVAGLLAEAGIPLADGAPLALYVGLVTDTGRFQYANTTPRAHRLAARLLEEGVAARLRLLHALRVAAAGAPAPARPRARPGAGRGRRPPRDHLAHARRLRRRPAPTTPPPTASSTRCARSRASSWPRSSASRATHGPARKVSLRSRAGGLDCSAIARERGGGGHPGAAGFSTDESVEEIVGVP